MEIQVLRDPQDFLDQLAPLEILVTLVRQATQVPLEQLVPLEKGVNGETLARMDSLELQVQ